MRAGLRPATVVPIAAATLLLACGHPAPTTGLIVGLASPCTGPSPVPAGYVHVVTVRDADGQVVSTQRLADTDLPAARRADARAFRFALPAGHYELTAPGDYSASADVRGGKTVNVTLGAECL